MKKLFKKVIGIIGIMMLVSLGKGYAQDIDALSNAIVKDDTTALSQFATKEVINTCYGKYTALSHAVRMNAKNCFSFLIARGANINLACDDYVSPLMFAAKYDRLEMVKILVAKGADPSKKYEGASEPAKGKNAIEYARFFERLDVVEYLEGIKK